MVGWLVVDEMSRGKWVKSTDEYAHRQQGKPGHIVQYNRHLSLAALVLGLNKSSFFQLSAFQAKWLVHQVYKITQMFSIPAGGM